MVEVFGIGINFLYKQKPAIFANVVLKCATTLKRCIFNVNVYLTCLKLGLPAYSLNGNYYHQRFQLEVLTTTCLLYTRCFNLKHLHLKYIYFTQQKAFIAKSTYIFYKYILDVSPAPYLCTIEDNKTKKRLKFKFF